MTTTPSPKKSRLVDRWVSSFDLNSRRKFTINDENGEPLEDLYFKPLTRSDRLRVMDTLGTDDGYRMSTAFLCQMAELEDGSKAFSMADVPKLQRELPEKELARVEGFLFEVGENSDIEEVKND
tara:strand:+ start:329 stop:700 length:372 start_codon:yes stop_codon:yes gene_type:complete